MNFLVSLIKTIFSRKKQSQIIHIDPGLLIKFIFPDKASLFPILCNSRISKHFPVFIRGVHIKYENSIRIKIIVHQFKYSKQILLLCDVIHTVTDADDSTYRSIKFKLPHILFQIKDLMAGFCTFFHGFAKHFLRVIHTDHIITGLSQKLCHHSGPTAKFQHDPVFNSVFFKTSYKIFRPFFIFHIIHENIINSGKIAVCFHKNLQIFFGRSIARSVHIIPCLPV